MNELRENLFAATERMREVRSDIRGPLYREALRMQKEGIPVLKINTGNPASFGFEMPDSVRNALLQGMDSAVPYCEPRGMAAARAAILEYQRDKKGFIYSNDEDVFIGNGVSELAQMCTLATLDAGDEVLCPCPNYSLWTNCIILADAKPVFYRCDEQSGWIPDVKDIESKITPRTKALLIINPNNPTGVLYPDDVLLQMLDIARKHHLMVYSDEIYDRLVITNKEHHSCAYLAPDVEVITFNGLSKSHIICGFRCGWMVLHAPKDQLREVRSALEQLASMRLCGNTLTQLVVPAALKDVESTQAMLVPGGRLYEQRKVVLETLKGEGISCVPNDASFYVFPRFDAARMGITDDRDFALKVLKEKHVLIVPGSGFSYSEPDHFRIVMLPEVNQLRTAVQSIVDLIESMMA